MYTHKQVKASTLQEAFTPGKQNDGSDLKAVMDYGFGWIVLAISDSVKGAGVYTGGYPGYQSAITQYIDKQT